MTIFRRGGRKGWTLRYRDPVTLRARTRTFRTRTAAQAHADALASGAGDVTLAQYAATWIQRAAIDLREGTVRQYRWALDGYALPALGHRTLLDLGRDQVKDMLAHAAATGLSRKSVAKIRQTLHALLEEAREDGHVASNAAQLGSRGRRAARAAKVQAAAGVQALTPEQLAAFLRAADEKLDPALALMLRTMALTGIRPGEALGLQWDDVDLAAGELLIRRSISAGRREEPTKTEAQRPVDVATGLSARLEAWDTRTREIALQAGTQRAPWVFPGRQRWMDAHTVQNGMKRALRAARLPGHHSPKSLRHTYASIMLSQGQSPYYVQRQLGHSTITMTTNTYGRWLPAGNRAAVDALEGLLAPRVAPIRGTSSATDPAKPAKRRLRRR